MNEMDANNVMQSSQNRPRPTMLAVTWLVTFAARRKKPKPALMVGKQLIERSGWNSHDMFLWLWRRLAACGWSGIFLILALHHDRGNGARKRGARIEGFRP